MQTQALSLFLLGLAGAALAGAREPAVPGALPQEAAPAVSPAPADPARAEVEGVVRAFARAFYDVAPERLEPLLEPSVVRHGLFRAAGGEAARETRLDRAAIVALAGSWNQSAWMPPEPPAAVVVLDVSGDIASARLEAAWGVELLQLLRRDGTWRVAQTLWQSVP